MASIGTNYTFSYVGGRVYDPELCSGKGICVGMDGNHNIFHVKLPGVINDITGYLLYTVPRDLKQAEQPSDADREAAERIARYIKTFAYANQKPAQLGGRVDTTVYISQSKIDSFLEAATASAQQEAS